MVFPTRVQYPGVVAEYRDGGFEMCADLCGVDYLAHPGRRLPEGVQPERFEVVVNLLSLSQARRVRVRVQVPGADAEVATLFHALSRASRPWSGRPTTSSASSSSATRT